jgi:hypothetical protein
MRLTHDQCDEIIDVVRQVRDDLAAIGALERQLAHLERPDGWRRSVRPAESSRPATDADGEPLPSHVDTTGSTVVARIEGRTTGVRREIDVLAGAVAEMLALARQADGARARALEPGKEHSAPDGCRNHEQHQMGWEPVQALGRCRWCREFFLAEGHDAPKVLLEKRARGLRVSVADVERALAHRRSKRARARRRRAS